MRWAMASKIRTGVAVAVALAGPSAARAQLPMLSIEDARVLEGAGSVSVTVRLSSYPGTPVTVSWKTVDGWAKAGQEYVYGGSTLLFSDANPQTFTVTVLDDSTDEWDFSQMDKAFFVELYGVSTNATLLKRRATVTIVDDDRTLPGLQHVSAVADGTATVGRVRLQWRVPASSTSGPVTDVLVRWNTGSTCVAPSNTAGGMGGFYVRADLNVWINGAGETQVVEHLTPPPFARHCYALFAIYNGTGISGTPTTELPPPTVAATPFDAAYPNPVAWAYSVGTSSGGSPTPTVVPPTVGAEAVYTIDNFGVVHAMTRGVNGGTWPHVPAALENWNPVGLGRPASDRSPVVPLPYGSRLFVGTQDGEVHAVNGSNGAIAWSLSSRFGNPFTGAFGVQATPAGLFTGAGGQNDVILVGSYLGTSNSHFYMLDPVTGEIVSSYPSDASMGGVRGMGAVVYDNPVSRVFFLANGATAGALWALDLGAQDFPALSLSTLPPIHGNPVVLPGGVGVIGSPVTRKGRVYFGEIAGALGAYRVFDGALVGTNNLGTGNLKGFPFPDRRNGMLYFSTDSAVWGVMDTDEPAYPSFSPKWWVTLSHPSILLYRPLTDFLYVGDDQGRLWQIELNPNPDLPPKSQRFLQLESPGFQIGAPSLDGPNNLVLVGSTSGTTYAVRADPFAGIPLI